MASSSDTANAVRGFVPPQNDDERRLMRRVEELCRVAVSRGIPRYTGFLSDREQSLAQAACNKAGCSCIRFWGGFDAAERRVLCIEPVSYTHLVQGLRQRAVPDAACPCAGQSDRRGKTGRFAEP